MKQIQKIILLTTGLTLLFSCSLLGPKRQRIKEVERQSIPKELLNTYWTLDTYDNKRPDCEILMGFLEKGQLVFKFKGELYDGDYLWYFINDSKINFHVSPLDKLDWTGTDNCEMNPAAFARYIEGNKPFNIHDGQLIFKSFDNKELKFKKV